MEDLTKDLNDLGEILCNYYRPSHERLYPLRRLGVEMSIIHHSRRKKEITSDDREKIQNILTRLYGYVDNADHYKKYYLQLCIYRTKEILDGI